MEKLEKGEKKNPLLELTLRELKNPVFNKDTLEFKMLKHNTNVMDF